MKNNVEKKIFYKQKPKQNKINLNLIIRLIKIIFFSIFSIEKLDEIKKINKTDKKKNILLISNFILIFIFNFFLIFILVIVCTIELLIGFKFGECLTEFSKLFIETYKNLNIKPFIKNFLYSSLWIIIIEIIITIRQFLIEIISIIWRKKLTENLQNIYFKEEVYYVINVLDNRIDNPGNINLF
jgi:ABC-type uncharacterized transport system fused permease/ATPase subunit